MTPFEIYVLLKLNTVIAFFGVIAGALALGGFGYGMHCSDNNHKPSKKIIALLAIPFMLCFLMALAIPSTEQATKMIVLPKVLTGHTIAELEKLPPKVLEILDLGTDLLQKELRLAVDTKTNSKAK